KGGTAWAVPPFVADAVAALLAAVRAAQAVARHAPGPVLVEAERHQLAHRRVRLGERGRHGDVEIEALGNAGAGGELRTAHRRLAARAGRAQPVAVDGDLLDEVVSGDQALHG